MTSAYAMMSAAIATVLPAGWNQIDYEPLASLPDVTSVTLKIRTVSRLPSAPIGAYRVEWIVTVTSPYPSRETADPQLFDDLIEFLASLDADESLSWLAWTEATKTVGDDLERLAYDITVITHTQRDVPVSA